jgi:hypothetical protein
VVRRPERNRPLERPSHRWEDNIKVDVKEIGLEGIEWIHLAQDKDWKRAVMNMAIGLRVP